MHEHKPHNAVEHKAWEKKRALSDFPDSRFPFPLDEGHGKHDETGGKHTKYRKVHGVQCAFSEEILGRQAGSCPHGAGNKNHNHRKKFQPSPFFPSPDTQKPATEAGYTSWWTYLAPIRIK